MAAAKKKVETKTPMKAQVIGPDSYEKKVSKEGEIKHRCDFSSWKEYHEYKGAKG